MPHAICLTQYASRMTRKVIYIWSGTQMIGSFHNPNVKNPSNRISRWKRRFFYYKTFFPFYVQWRYPEFVKFIFTGPKFEISNDSYNYRLLLLKLIVMSHLFRRSFFNVFSWFYCYFPRNICWLIFFVVVFSLMDVVKKTVSTLSWQ